MMSYLLLMFQLWAGDYIVRIHLSRAPGREDREYINLLKF